ncbi:RdgB/HAM1 family non-canonical purine NTP pyrophosphatase [Kiloniella laminariae]|uniref:dITP/XTP pyrophosphatase n=1 Tax=Kiloniella laminariae TaxID=454162 RepID=A0ABT4LJF5_9PROT|nr:RdgB/HAM1 family non-canonical purine NTP pyrophosphatase [Kiloniella laminariae]MCZ4281239.1 RdgB/HAM1 family non-canonical purine NTP pyrophosphatase [Kiloniella laminariae]
MPTHNRPLNSDKLVLATHNAGKLREIAELLAPYGIDVVSAGDLGLPEPVEDGDSFAANARIKALAAAKGSGYPALSDDSGLAVVALNGDPGIYSARWAGPTKDFSLAMTSVEQALAAAAAKGDSNRAAYFICALCLAWPDGSTEVFEGRVDGTIVHPARGNQGFGYDPIFQAEGESITFGEMDPARKHSMSHRARAFALLVEQKFKA